MSQPNRNEGASSIEHLDERIISTIPHGPTSTYRKKELHVDPEYVAQQSLQSPPHRSRDPDQFPQFPTTPLLLHSSLPASGSRMSTFDDQLPTSDRNPPQPRTRHRTRKIVTNEVQPSDSESVVVLGLSPFMPGKDAMFNQNRLVRNEVILARHLSRLQQAYFASESTHAQRAQDFYRVLSDHKSSIDLLKMNNNATSPIQLHPDFTALVEAHNETRKALDELTKDIASFSSTTRQSIEFLTDSVRRLTSPFPENSESTIDSSHPEQTILSVGSLKSSPILLEGPLFAGIKRKRSPSGLSLSISVPPTSQPPSSATTSGFVSRSNSILNDSKMEVIYGPIKNDVDLLDPTKIGTDAVRSVGLSPSMIHSIRIASERPEYLAIRFLKTTYGSRFIDLVPFGDHPERHAFVVDDQSK